MSRVPTVASADLRRAYRERRLWGAVVLLGAMFLPSTASIAASGHRTIGAFLLQMPLDLVTFALVVVAAVGYDAVVGERTSGRVRFLLGRPCTRRDLVLGKLLSRAVVVAVALALVLGLANVLVARGYGRAHLAAFWTMGAWVLLYGVVWTAVAVGYSAAFASGYRTLAALVATYVTFSPDFGVWSVLVRPLFALAVTGSPDAPTYEVLANAPAWLRVTERLNPLTDFWYAMRWSVEAVGPGTPTGSPLPHVIGTGVFLLFGAVPLVAGLRRFEVADLGDEGGGGPSWGDRLWRAIADARGRIAGGRSGPAAAGGRPRALAVARADVRHALQSWVVLGALAVFVLLVVPQLWQGIETSTATTVTEALADIPQTFGLPVLVLGIAVGYGAVAGERETGTVRLVLGLPVTRRNLVLGKLLSRLAITAATAVALLAFAEVLVVVRFGGVHPAAMLAWSGSVLGFALVWTSVVVGLSAATASRYRTLAAVGGTYLLFGTDVGLWGPVVRPLLALVFTGEASVRGFVHDADGGPLWFRYADGLNPFVSLETFRAGLFVAAGRAPEYVHATAPMFLYSVAILFLFGAVPVYLGYRRFDGSDLG